MKKDTTAIHTAYPRQDTYNALSMPVYHSVAFEFDDADSMADAFCGRTDMPDYSRVGNPTVTHLEQKVQALTGASAVTAFNSGMAAISAMLFAVARAGGNIVSSRHLFGNTYSMLTSTLGRLGVEARLVDLTDPAAVEAATDAQTCCIFLEIITNPQMEVADVRRLGEIARKAGCPLIADTTMIPFTEFNASALGIDFEIVSSTKYLSGGATSLGGLIIDYGHWPELTTRIKKEILFNLGAYMTPHAAYMQTVGLETLGVRYRRQAATALEVAKALQHHPAVRKVNYLGLTDNPAHKLAGELYGNTYGAMLTIDLKDGEACRRFINALKLVKRATNLFDNRTLAIHPASTIFGPFTPEQRAGMDVLDTTIR
ncbi:MAG: PLP-dependent transferase, partial [Muribaculaceae bacterium]|nr:PLP-dependent transferase [Muribaculaceae bacterium]